MEIGKQQSEIKMKRPKGDGDMQAGEIVMRHLPTISIYGFVGGRQI